MAKYQKYAEYKDSGVEWLGEIPSHWVIQKLKWEITAKSGTDAKSEDGEFDLYGANGLIGKSSTFIDLSKLPVVLVGRVGSAGSLNYLTQCAGISDNALIIENNKYKTSRFEFYLLSSLKLEELVSKNAQPLITASNIRDIIVPISLDINERTQIANFLDHETAKIDSLIDKQQQLIELLKEKRQAVTSHAVTKGLNPDVAMKDSGIEWLGEVPEHWQFPRLKQLIQYGSSISYGIVQPGDALDEGVPFIQTTNISKGSFELEDFQKTSVSIESNYPRSRLEGGEVILGIRASIGAAFVVPMSFKGVNLSRGIARIIPNNLLRSDFLVWYFKSNTVDQYWGLSKQGSTFSEVSIETVRELNVVIPPLDEQETITKYLTNESNKFEKLINFAEKQKLLLLERRTALISAAVTGKIDVRNWQNPNNNNEAKTEFSA